MKNNQEDLYKKKLIDLHKDILRAFDVMAAMEGTTAKPLIEHILTEYAVKHGAKAVIDDYKKSLAKEASEKKKGKNS